LKFLVLLFSVLFVSNCFGWGKIGHRVVGEIAWKHLSPAARKGVDKLLAPRSLSYVTNWADYIRSNKQWDKAKPWHYVNFAKGESNYHKITHSKKGDIVQAIYLMESILRNSKNPKTHKTMALKFLAHLVGDIHQPLHAGYAEDYGGNKIKLNWFGKKSNLHRVWDEQLVEFQQLSFSEYTKELDKLGASEIKKLQRMTVVDWVKESVDLRDSCYKFEGTSLGYRYSYDHVKTMERQMLVGGIRLAGMLNGIFSNAKYSKKQNSAREKVKIYISPKAFEGMPQF